MAMIGMGNPASFSLLISRMGSSGEYIHGEFANCIAQQPIRPATNSQVGKARGGNVAYCELGEDSNTLTLFCYVWKSLLVIRSSQFRFAVI